MCWLLLLLLGCRERIGPDPAPMVPHPPRAWARLLERAVDARGDIDYDAVRAERQTLEDYLRWIARPDALEGRSGQAPHAFWLNAFNAWVIYQVIDRDIRQTVREVPSILPVPGARFWFGTEFVVAGRPMSLWELGHERITHLNQDYRDFAALAVAARSGPAVPRSLFTADGIEAQLDEQNARFFGSDRGARWTPRGRLLFNPVYDRYDLEMDLYTGGRSLCAVAALHTTGERQARFLEAEKGGCPHGFFRFDWALNDAGGAD